MYKDEASAQLGGFAVGATYDAGSCVVGAVGDLVVPAGSAGVEAVNGWVSCDGSRHGEAGHGFCKPSPGSCQGDAREGGVVGGASGGRPQAARSADPQVERMEQPRGLAEAEPDRDERPGVIESADKGRYEPWNKPCAAPGLKSYRIRGPFGWILIGASDDEDALKEARRSTNKPETESLEVWMDGGYRRVSARS